MTRYDIQVVKLGGSLLGLPDLPARLDAYRQMHMTPRSALVVGGGSAADTVRQFDQHHRLGQEAGHWLAIHAMRFNTYLVASILPRCRIVVDTEACTGAWANGDLPIIDPLAWLENEHRSGVTIPHRWSFTSDSIAAHIATRLGARRLALLKSTLPDDPCDVTTAVRLGMTDGDFEAASATIPHVELVNLRALPPAKCVLRQG